MLTASQFEKFQGFAAQLTKEASDLKAKIEQHKKENSRLSKLIDQQKVDSNTAAVRLSATEKQRDEALEALVMQQEVAENLERERKKNKRELSELVRNNHSIMRQRDEAQRVVIHLRALIEGQAHHVEHLVRSLGDPEPEEIAEEEDVNGTPTAPTRPTSVSYISRRTSRTSSRSSSRTASRASTIDVRGLDSEDVSPDMERRLVSSPSMKRFSQMSWSDVADRNIRDKTDAIADIIRNISEQCAAAVEGLHLAQAAAEQEEEAIREEEQESEYDSDRDDSRKHVNSRKSTVDESSLLRPGDRSSVPSTPELTHRASTAMSMSSTLTPERNSLGGYGDVDVPTKILETDNMSETGDERDNTYLEVSKSSRMRHSDMIVNRATPASLRLVPRRAGY